MCIRDRLFADPTSAAAVALGGVVVSVNTCANLVGRLSFGQIIDKLGAYKSLLISLVVTIVALVTVSYTHLDVYKRQAQTQEGGEAHE